MAQPHTEQGEVTHDSTSPPPKHRWGLSLPSPCRVLAANLVSKKPGDEQLLFSLEVFTLRLRLCSARAKGEPCASDGADTALIQGASQGL